MLGGGWPLNGVNEIIGNESQRQDLASALKTIAAQQALDPNYHTVWAASEDFDFGWAATLGVDASRMTFIMSNIMEEVYEACLEVMRKRAADAVIIDSLPALVPSWEDEKTMAEMTVGKGALLTNKFMRKSYTAASRSFTEYERPILVIVSTSGVMPSSSSVTLAPRLVVAARTTPTSPASRRRATSGSRTRTLRSAR